MKNNNNNPVAFPSIADMANGKYWTRVADEKLIPFVKFTTTDEAIKKSAVPGVGK